ncbi:MAG: HEAT repeat domain-containing protein [Candidatus Brocadiae bacterium]|nr:HEAT repeat domain-containing protein [Candidatus Brocadiia bacterium]
MARRLPILILGAVVLLAGCGGKSTEEELVEVSNTSGIQRMKIEELAKKGVPAIQPLLKSKKMTVRLAAIGALGFLKKNPEATQLLVGVAKGDQDEEAYFAIIALARQRAGEAKAVIEEAMKSKVARRRQAACIAIAEYGDEALYPLIIKAAQDRDRGVAKTAQSTARRCKIEEALEE